MVRQIVHHIVAQTQLQPYSWNVVVGCVSIFYNPIMYCSLYYHLYYYYV